MAKRKLRASPRPCQQPAKQPAKRLSPLFSKWHMAVWLAALIVWYQYAYPIFTWVRHYRESPLTFFAVVLGVVGVIFSVQALLLRKAVPPAKWLVLSLTGFVGLLLSFATLRSVVFMLGLRNPVKAFVAFAFFGLPIHLLQALSVRTNVLSRVFYLALTSLGTSAAGFGIEVGAKPFDLLLASVTYGGMWIGAIRLLLPRLKGKS